jgi:hypothetical protein
MIPERSASVNLNGGAPDGIAIAIDVKRVVGGADDDRDWSARAALRLPVVVIIRERAQHLGRKILRRKHQAGFDARCGTGVLPSPTTTVPPFDVSLKSSCEKSYGRRMQPWLAG